MLQAFDAVMNGPHGTARDARIADAGFEMGGKTGTSQVRHISMAERETGVLKNENLPWRQRDHALFVGFAPVANPRYAVCVVVEHGGGGSHVAAPDCPGYPAGMPAARSCPCGGGNDADQTADLMPAILCAGER